MFSEKSFSTDSFSQTSYAFAGIIEPPEPTPEVVEVFGGGSSGTFIVRPKIKRVSLAGGYEGHNVATGEISVRAELAGRYAGFNDGDGDHVALALLDSGREQATEYAESQPHCFIPPTERTQINAALIVSFLRNKIKAKK